MIRGSKIFNHFNSLFLSTLFFLVLGCPSGWAGGLSGKAPVSAEILSLLARAASIGQKGELQYHLGNVLLTVLETAELLPVTSANSIENVGHKLEQIHIFIEQNAAKLEDPTNLETLALLTERLPRKTRESLLQELSEQYSMVNGLSELPTVGEKSIFLFLADPADLDRSVEGETAFLALYNSIARVYAAVFKPSADYPRARAMIDPKELAQLTTLVEVGEEWLTSRAVIRPSLRGTMSLRAVRNLRLMLVALRDEIDRISPKSPIKFKVERTRGRARSNLANPRKWGR